MLVSGGESPPMGKSAVGHEVGQQNLPKLGQSPSMGAILDRRKGTQTKGKVRLQVLKCKEMSSLAHLSFNSGN